MTGNDFTYDGYKLSDFNLMMCQPEEEIAWIGREISRTELSETKDISYFKSVYHNDVLVHKFSFIKNVCNETNYNNGILTDANINDIRTWLESSHTEKDLIIYKNNSLNVTYYGVFSDVQPFLVGNLCYGINATFTCNAPYGFSRPINILKNPNNKTTNIVFDNQTSNKYDPIYPKIRIKAKTTFMPNNTVTITNSSFSDDNSVKFTLPYSLSHPKSVLDIDFKSGIISTDNGEILSLSDIGIKPDANASVSFLSNEVVKFNKIKMYRGNNNIKFDIDDYTDVETITLTAQYPIKSGGL